MLPTAIVYHSNFVKHVTPKGHPESAMRYIAIENELRKCNFQYPVEWFEAQNAEDDVLLLCHTKDYVQKVKREVERVKKAFFLPYRYLSTGDVIISPDSFEVAKLAVGAVIQASDLVMQAKVKNAFCMIRPPGHHACSDKGMGFCLFNNVAIGARYIQKKYNLERILIVDWDLHHGNGTQEIFENDPSVFYFSTHQEGIYPGTGLEEDRGIGKALGTKCNIPIHPSSSSTQQILNAFSRTLSEYMKSFRPEFVFISCGFDAHRLDPLGELDLTSADFRALTQDVLNIALQYCSGRVVSCLEGGYSLEAIRESAREHVLCLSTNSL